LGVVSNSSNVDMVGRVGVGGDPSGRRAFLGAASHLFRCLVRAPMIVGLSIVLGIGFAAGMREREREFAPPAAAIESRCLEMRPSSAEGFISILRAR